MDDMDDKIREEVENLIGEIGTGKIGSDDEVPNVRIKKLCKILFFCQKLM